ncbi:immunoglobulin-binding protein 1 [Sitodiplosis mosellana]|uniref:immunoglobulin-binding protein 1 n=1 Tax=Sitodiplosis mosellana TaxID=263140 RepID=UPI002444C3D3|nr:immunoglobulin-binding protein 1 [Sitodiplosis mosellana]
MSETTVDRKLLDIFEEAFDLYYSFETCTEPTNSPEFQSKIKKCIRLFEDCTRLVSICGLFSTNENYTELPTSDLKYLLLPFFLGTLSQKICGDSRADVVEVAEIYFKDFLKRCSDYGIYEPVPRTTGNNEVASANANNEQINVLTQQVLHRNQKLEKYRQKKELEDQIKHLKVVMKREEVDDDTKRDFYVKLLKMSVIETQEELSSIDMEKKMLEFQQQDHQQLESHSRRLCKAPPVRPLKPIIITRDFAQKAVYGLGYPSLPTMTVSEFYDQRVREGIFPDPNNAPPRNADNSLQSRFMQEQSNDIEEQEDIDREKKLDVDDDYELARLRARDEYKDEHRRGEGNRYNRS